MSLIVHVSGALGARTYLKDFQLDGHENAVLISSSPTYPAFQNHNDTRSDPDFPYSVFSSNSALVGRGTVDFSKEPCYFHCLDVHCVIAHQMYYSMIYQ